MQPFESDEVKGRSLRLGKIDTPYKGGSSDKRVPRTELLASTLDSAENIDTSLLPGRFEIPSIGPKTMEAATKVLSASLLITGNTVGSSMFVLPDAVSGVGLLNGSAIFIGLYLYNLISGLLLADVAIKLHESSDCEVPSSFKDFADAAMKSEAAGNAIGAASLLINSCFLAFGISHAGHLVANTLPEFGLEPTSVAAGFATILAVASFTQTNHGLEKIANVAVMVLFSSFASLLLPSLANVSDPMGTLLAPGTNPEGFGPAAAAAIPLILSSLTYQNIVPSITKLLDFDRTKSSAAIALGSFLPVAVYIAWCFAALGGGLDNSALSGAGGAALATFSAAALIGSCVACTMSLAEEYESLISSALDSDEHCTVKDKFSIPAVTMAVAPPAAVVLATGCSDLTCALHFCGAFVTPFLYGLLPILLFQTISKKDGEVASPVTLLPSTILASGAVGFIGQEIIHDVSQIIA
jgi:tyrosine-specific transport protein